MELQAVALVYIGFTILSVLYRILESLPGLVSNPSFSPLWLGPDFATWFVVSLGKLVLISLTVGLVGMTFAGVVRFGEFDFGRDWAAAKQHGWKIVFSLVAVWILPFVIYAVLSISVSHETVLSFELAPWSRFWFLFVSGSLLPVVYAVLYGFIGITVLMAEVKFGTSKALIAADEPT